MASTFTSGPIEEREIRVFHGFCGLGGGAKGFNRAQARVGNLRARFRCLGGFDVDPAAIRDFERMAGVRGTVLDLFTRSDYSAFHGREAPADFREATPADIRRAAGNERPHIVFLSAPCKAFSGLLSAARAQTERYQALSRLTVRGVWLMLEAWQDSPPELFLFENVPLIASHRGRHLLDQIAGMLRAYGYAVRETTHDCGELGGLAQSRKRFLLVARHVEKVPAYLYQPIRRPLAAVGTLLDRMLLPDDPAAGPMHRLPSLHWRTWVRLAFVRAGADWRSLNELAVQDGILRDFLIVPAQRNGTLGVMLWEAPAGTITGNARPMTGAFNVADPRSPTEWHRNVFRVVRWTDASGTVTGDFKPTAGGGVADPRFAASDRWHEGQAYGVLRWSEPTGAIAGQQAPGQGTYSIADPREPPSGPARVAALPQCLPQPHDRLVAFIRSLDGTYHRPFTRLELAVIQGLVEPEERLELHGESASAHSERIGNAVPPAAAEAIGSEMGRTLLLAWSGETFRLEATPVWVRNVAVALALHDGESGGAVSERDNP
jgi:site-specific DNA-cytosine methylase